MNKIFCKDLRGDATRVQIPVSISYGWEDLPLGPRKQSKYRPSPCRETGWAMGPLIPALMKNSDESRE